MGCSEIQDICDALPGNSADTEKEYFIFTGNAWWPNRSIADILSLIAGIGRKKKNWLVDESNFDVSEIDWLQKPNHMVIIKNES
jgi:hypothetical protein